MSLRLNLKAAATVMSIAVAAFAADWPSFHGADRTNKSSESGLLKSWPKEGPKLLFTASGIGEGYSSVAIVGGALYTAGVKEGVNHVFAFDRSGKPLWEKKAGKAWEATRAFARAYSGARSTPTVDNGVVYYLSDTGLLIALNASTGEEMWQINLPQKYEAAMPTYGYSESPLIIGDKLYCTPYGKKVTALCLNKKTGAVIWESEHVKGENTDAYAGYASFIVIENGGVKHLVGFTSLFIYGLNLENGKILWTAPFKNDRDNNCTDIVYNDGYILASSGYGRGTIVLKLTKQNDKFEVSKAVDVKLMDNHHGGIVLHDGNVYGSGHEVRGWFCLDLKTGKARWNSQGGKGSLTFAEGMLYLYDEKGTMTLIKATPEAYAPISSFDVPAGGKGAYWAHPVIANGVLYLRHADNLYAYDIKQK